MIPVRNFKFSIIIFQFLLLIFLIDFDGKILTGEVPSRAASVTGNRGIPRGSSSNGQLHLMEVILLVIYPIKYIKII